MRLAMLVMSLLAAVPGAAAAQTATVIAPAATVSGVTVTNAGTYTAQSVSAPSRAGQLSPTGTIGSAVNWHFVSNSAEVAGQVGTQFGIEFRIDGNPVGDGVSSAGYPQSEYRRYDAYGKYRLSKSEDRRALPAGLWLRQRLGNRAGSLDSADLVSGPHAG